MEPEVRLIAREALFEQLQQEFLGRMIKKGIQKAGKAVKKTAQAVAREAKETAQAARILSKLVRNKKPTPQEIQFLKLQSVDIAKALALIGLQAVPGSSIGIVALEKLGQKYGFTLFPKSHEMPEGE